MRFSNLQLLLKKIRSPIYDRRNHREVVERRFV